MQKNTNFWPNNAKLAISISMQFEAGGEPDHGADSPFSGSPLPPEYPDLPAKTWFEYGYQEGYPAYLIYGINMELKLPLIWLDKPYLTIQIWQRKL